MQILKHYRRTVTFLFANGAAGADLIQSKGLPFTGEILHIRQVNADVGAATAQLEIVDSHGVTIWDGTAKNHNTSTDHEFGVTTHRILDGEDTLRCTISADPTATYKIDAVISLFGRE